MRKKVLWVDDEIEFLRSQIMFLETRGYSVTPVFSGDDAIQMIKQNIREYDIVLLDEQMPGKDGLTTLEEIKALQPDLPVVMVTQNDQGQRKGDAVEKRIDGYLTKPINSNQILSVCKKLLHSKQIISSQISQKFMRAYSQYRTVLQNHLGTTDWIDFYEELTRWDFELTKVENEGIRQIHAGQKSDANAIFSNYYMENYLRWIHGSADAPLLTPDVLKTTVFPKLRKGEKVVLLMFDSLRLDQFRALEETLKRYFNISRSGYYSILPTSPSFTRHSLLSGLYPEDIAREYPDLGHLDSLDTTAGRQPEAQMLEKNLRDSGVQNIEDIPVFPISNNDDSQKLLDSIDQIKDASLIPILLNFFDILTKCRSTSVILQESAPDENTFHSLTASWFKESVILQVIRKLGASGHTIVITAANGSILCTRGTELYGIGEGEVRTRYRFGEKVTCDERHALFVAEPQRFRLPSYSPDTACVILKENYYFIRSDKFENYQKQYQNSFQYGGISMGEAIVPLAVLKPR